MQKFLLIYRMPAAAAKAHMEMDKETKEKVMGEWMAWKDRCGDAMVDMGAPLGKQHVVTTSGDSEASDDVTGYSLVQAADIDGAKALLKDHPFLSHDAENCSISVYPAMAM